ncbi:MAG: hypothetical protein KGZ51_07385 [Erysipelothrix sp.]|nr:hypothetical protein [Erysipelothrix sp.]
MKLKAFISSATSNRSIIQNRSVSLWWQFIILLFSLIMIAFPFIVGRFNVNEAYLDANFPDFTDDFVLALERGECDFEDFELSCTRNNIVIDGARYTVYILPSENTTFKPESIIFYPTTLRVTRSFEQTIESIYPFFNQSFDQILLDMNNQEFEMTPKKYSINVLRNLDLAAMPADMWFIYMSLAVQYLLYLFVISALIWWLYSKRGSIKLPFKEITAMLIVVMFWTALPTALLGFFASTLASVLFTIFYVTRIIFMYTKLTREIRV